MADFDSAAARSRGDGRAAQIAQMFGVHLTQVGGWKKQALAGLPDIFDIGREQMRQQSDTEKDELYKQIGQMKVELDFIKKSWFAGQLRDAESGLDWFDT